MASFIAELKRRNVFKVGVVYAIVAWLAIQVASIILPTFNAPEWVMQVFVVLLLLGFPIAIILAWAYELTPEGIKREKDIPQEESNKVEKGKRLNVVIISLLLVAVLILLYERSIPPTMVSLDNSVAVLPFADLSPQGDQQWFADGLADEILNSLTQIPDLLVTSRTSSFQFRNQELSIADVADILGVAHVVEGSVRRIGDELRVTAQLIRASDDFHLWSETYERETDDLFAVQEDIAEKIAVALNIIMDDDKRQSMFSSGTRNVEAFEAFQRGRVIYEEVHNQRTDESLYDANVWFEQAVELDPGYSFAYLMHADAYTHLLMHGRDNQFSPISKAASDISDDEALQQLRQDMDNAFRTATDPDIRLSIDYTRTIFRDSWDRLPDLITSLNELIQEGKFLEDTASWYSLQIVLGNADHILAWTRTMQAKNPLSGNGWFSGVNSLLALDRYSDAIDIAERGRSVAGQIPNLTYGEALAYAFSGDLETTVNLYRNAQDNRALERKIFEAYATALEGNYEEATVLAESIEQEFPVYDRLLLVYNEIGDVGKVAELAREIDSSALGPQRLILFLSNHSNSLPFSLDDTPNFKQRLAEAGLNEDDFRTMPRFSTL